MVDYEVGGVGCLMGFGESMACTLVDDSVAAPLVKPPYVSYPSDHDGRHTG